MLAVVIRRDLILIISSLSHRIHILLSRREEFNTRAYSFEVFITFSLYQKSAEMLNDDREQKRWEDEIKDALFYN